MLLLPLLLLFCVGLCIACRSCAVMAVVCDSDCCGGQPVLVGVSSRLERVAGDYTRLLLIVVFRALCGSGQREFASIKR